VIILKLAGLIFIFDGFGFLWHHNEMKYGNSNFYVNLGNFFIIDIKFATQSAIILLVSKTFKF